MSEHPSGEAPADSAGVPWRGRTFRPQPYADDDGAVPPAYAEALAGFRTGRAPAETVVDALRETRLLVPLLAELGEAGTGPDGRTVDKSAELAIVTVSGPDGREVLPAFTGVETMRAWNARARPVPVPARHAALAAVDAGTELLVLDPGTDEEFGLRRPAVWAIAKDEPWRSPWRSEEALERIGACLRDEPLVEGVDIRPGGRPGRLEGSELQIVLHVPEAAAHEEREALTAGLRERLAADARLVELVDSVAVTTTIIPPGGLRRPRTGLLGHWWRGRGRRRGG